jgi:hypothetical protein
VCLQIYPPAWYDLGATYRTLGDGATAQGDGKLAVKNWQAAYDALHPLLGDTPEVKRLQGRLAYHRAGKNKGKMMEALKLLQSM